MTRFQLQLQVVISAGLEPVLSHTEKKTFKASSYRQFLTNVKMKPILIVLRSQRPWLTKLLILKAVYNTMYVINNYDIPMVHFTGGLVAWINWIRIVERLCSCTFLLHTNIILIILCYIQVEMSKKVKNSKIVNKSLNMTLWLQIQI